MKPSVLIVDDEPLQRDILETILAEAGYEVQTAATGREALQRTRSLRPDVVLSDLRMAGMDGMGLLDALNECQPSPTVIMVTAHGTITSAVEAVKRGAFDYLTKPLDKEQLLLAVRKACERSQILRENMQLRQQLYDRFRMEGIIGRSPRMHAVIELLKRVSGAPATVMLRGESGTGKELVARAIHYNSPRRGRPFTALNCAAIPENLFESELFGYEAGAFTGAVGRREGLIEVANGGTLFLDEIGDLPLTMQSKLLRVLQDREIRRVGGKEQVKVDVRIISATNKDLEQAVEQKSFREDLYYRLNVVFIELPPLRERVEDIPALVEHFLAKYNAEFGRRVREIRPDALRALQEFRWPGNVRQLEAVIERALLLSDSDVLSLADIRPLLVSRRSERHLWAELPADGIDLEAVEKELLHKALVRSGGVATRAAKLLHMNYKQFLYRAEKYGIKAGDGDGAS
ncbi:sigma-54 dependent transcriptional regulator [Desulfuromonas carbonis]|uniref:sigma-54-dependent transcriptional regulator n=1 Tax=Desulfuromonas sp. DDH964 TaxID=1823759 RepID=UPI00078BE98C|nr:sigma-54 dependent transcriptional regulator [Desulfuromonas sp. DDH964]AMV72447.1 sigma-54-dependent transcriptional response regulator [Desulfuromonas sp. DDH964]